MTPHEATGSHAGVRVTLAHGDDAAVGPTRGRGARRGAWREWRASPAGRGAALIAVAGTGVWLGAAVLAAAGATVALAARR